jgi:hypothetical protein
MGDEHLWIYRRRVVAHSLDTIQVWVSHPGPEPVRHDQDIEA